MRTFEKACAYFGYTTHEAKMELTMDNFVREFECMVSMKDQHGMVFGYMPDMLIVPPSAFSDALDCTCRRTKRRLVAYDEIYRGARLWA